MPTYRITDGAGSKELDADNHQAAATAALPITGRVAGVQLLTKAKRERGQPRFYLLRGATFYPISARVAAIEVAMP